MAEHPEPVVLEETRLANGWFKLAPPDIEKPRHLTIPEKLALEAKDALLTEKSVHRQERCWLCEDKAPHVWVREVGFDFKGDKAAPVQHVAISTADYVGPVPGFCPFCLAAGPARLAEVVYYDRPEMYWGARPTRWFVSFTDGTRTGDLCIAIDPTQAMPKIIEEYITND